jgi:hypothetical protein
VRQQSRQSVLDGSVSGLYLAHPRAEYFNVERIGRDQLKDLAARKRETVSGASWSGGWRPTWGSAAVGSSATGRDGG